MGGAGDVAGKLSTLAVGTEVALRAASPIWRGVYRSKVLGLEERGLRLSVPLDEGRLVLIPVGTAVELEAETADGRVRLEGQVLERKAGPERYLVVGQGEAPRLEAGVTAPAGNGAVHLEQRRVSSEEERVAKPIVAVTSGKGGVGKTTVAVNLGLALAERGKRVCLIDGDLGTANVDVVLNLTPRATLADVVRGGKHVLDVVVEGPRGLLVLPGGSGLQELTELDDRQFARLLAQLEGLWERADVLLVDTGSGLGRSVTNFLAGASTVVVVTTPDPPAVTDAYALMRVMAQRGIEADVRLVVNRALSEREAEDVMAKMIFASRRFLQVDLQPLGYIPEDSAVVRSVREQVPVTQAYPRSRAAEHVREIAGRLLAVVEGTGAREVGAMAERRRSVWGFLRAVLGGRER